MNSQNMNGHIDWHTVSDPNDENLSRTVLQYALTHDPQNHSRDHIHKLSFSEYMADQVAAKMGSWGFILIQTGIVLTWMTLNIVALISHWDPYPFILLNLLFSTQAAYASPIILMSSNRSASIDRKRDDHEAKEVSLIVVMNKQQVLILDAVHQMNFRQARLLDEVHQINTRQLQILDELHTLQRGNQ